jgi:hypothetical protein
VDSLHHVPPPATLSALSRAELEALLAELLGEVATLKQTVAEPREENARLKGLKGRPNIKPSGMEKGTAPPKPLQQEKRPGRGKVTSRVKVEEKVIRIEVTSGSIFKGHVSFLVQDPRPPPPAPRLRRGRLSQGQAFAGAGFRRGMPGDFGEGDLLPAGTPDNAGWTDDPGSIASGDRRPFRSGTAPLRADAIRLSSRLSVCRRGTERSSIWARSVS